MSTFTRQVAKTAVNISHEAMPVYVHIFLLLWGIVDKLNANGLTCHI